MVHSSVVHKFWHRRTQSPQTHLDMTGFVDLTEPARVPCCGTGAIQVSNPSSSRAELKGTNYMGQTGFCENLRFPAVFCENLRFPAVFCENLRLRNAVVPRKSKNLQKSAKVSEKLRIRLGLSHLVCPF